MTQVMPDGLPPRGQELANRGGGTDCPGPPRHGMLPQVQSPIPEYLAEVLLTSAPDTSGTVADYIPELATVDPELLGISLSTVDGAVYETGDSEVEFTIQSISKPFVYALALADRGLDAVIARVDVEPSGEAFNELSLEKGSGGRSTR